MGIYALQRIVVPKPKGTEPAQGGEEKNKG